MKKSEKNITISSYLDKINDHISRDIKKKKLLEKLRDVVEASDQELEEIKPDRLKAILNNHIDFAQEDIDWSEETKFFGETLFECIIDKRVKISDISLLNEGQFNMIMSGGINPSKIILDQKKSLRNTLIKNYKKHEIEDLSSKDPYFKNQFEKHNALPHAVEEDMYELIRFLIENNIGIFEKDTWGMTPLHWAAYKGFPDVVSSLLTKGVKIEERDKNESTPLFFAVQHELYKNCADHTVFYETIRVLLKNGANINVKNNEGKTPLDYAKEKNDEKMIDVFEEFSFVKNLIKRRADLSPDKGRG